MDLAQLKVFVRTAELESFTRAADSLGLAQPTVSRIIAELEAEWDGVLFRRTGRGVALSELGQEALRRVRPLLREVEQVSDDVRAFDRAPAGNVAIASTPSLITAVLPDLVSRLQAERPGIRLHVYEGFGSQVERWLAEGVADIGLFSRYGLAGENLATPRDALGVPVPSGLVLSRRADLGPLPAEVGFEDLADYPLVMPAATNALRVLAEALARQHGVRLNVVIGADSHLAREALALRCGLAMLRDASAIEPTGNMTFCDARVRAPGISRLVVLSTAPASRLGRAAQDVIARTKQILRRRWPVPA